MNTAIIWQGIKDAFNNSTAVSALFGYFKDMFGAGGSFAGAAAGAGYGAAFSVENDIVKQWWDTYGHKTKYVGSDGLEHDISGN